ncbi:MAG: porin [Gemmatimonadota bacterium]
MRKKRVTTLLGLLSALFIAGPAVAQELPDWVEKLKVSGVAFGDYYDLAAHHDEDLEGKHGFWFRRIYLTFDFKVDEDVDFRLRFEGNSAGDFSSSSKIEPFVKDAWVRWKPADQSVYLGISGTPTWGTVEKVWGYRAVEKTPLDLQKMGSSRDFGVAAKGPLDGDGKIYYHAMVGNGASTKGETNSGKAAYLALGVKPGGGFTLEVYGDYNELPGEADRYTLQAFGGWHGEGGRFGVQYARQWRETGPDSDIDLDIFSVFGVLEVDERVTLIGRYDRMFDPNPSADGISYLPMSPDAKSNFVLAGIDLAVSDHFSIIPNVETVFYDAVGSSEAPDTDVVPRLTFSLTF